MQILSPHCPACGILAGAFRDGPICELQRTGEMLGHRFNVIRCRNSSCLNCGQLYRTREYRYEPESKPSDEATGDAPKMPNFSGL